MVGRHLLLGAALLAFARITPCCGQATGPDTPGPASNTASNSLWFPVGEKLVHRIYWGFIPVGSSVTTTEWIDQDGKRLLAIRMKTRTNTVFDRIRPVNDRIESIVDPATFLPLKFSRVMIRRGSTCNETTVFDHKKGEAVWTAHCSSTTNTFAIDPDTRDIMTFMYYTRRKALPEDTVLDHRVMADDGMFDLKLTTRKKEDLSFTPFGKTTSLKIEPRFDFDGLLVDKGKFKLWVSDDNRRLLAKAVISGKLADITVLISRVEGPGDDSWIRLSAAGRNEKTEDARPDSDDADDGNSPE